MTLIWILIGLGAVVLVLAIIYFISRPRHKRADTSYEDALRALLDGREDEAIRRLRDTVTRDTDNIDAYIRLGKLIRQRGNAEKAAQIHQSLTVRSALARKEELRIYTELIEDYLAMGMMEKSIALLRELVRMSKEKLGYLRRLLALLVSAKRSEEAYDVLRRNERAFADKREAAAWYAQTALMQWERKDKVRAAETIKHANRLARDHPFALIVQIRIFASSEQQAKARTFLEKFLKAYPQYAEAVLDITEQVYFELGIYDKVVPLYEGLLKRYPEKREVRLRLARLLEKQGSPDEAASLVASALADNPSDVAYIIEHVKLSLEKEDCRTAQGGIERLEEMLVFSASVCPECGEALEPSAWFCPDCGAMLGE